MKNDRLENLRRHLRAARLALVSDELYEDAIAQLDDVEHERISERQSRFTRTAINMLNGET